MKHDYWDWELTVLVGLFIGALAAMLLALLSGCAHLTPQDQAEIASYEGQQGACIAASPKDRRAIDACRERVRTEWCAKWASRFDAGVCP